MRLIWLPEHVNYLSTVELRAQIIGTYSSLVSSPQGIPEFFTFAQFHSVFDSLDTLVVAMLAAEATAGASIV